MTCYRIVQEALNNVTRHAHAHNLTISLVRQGDSAQPERIVLTIADDGAGTSSALSAGGLGLVGMRERVEALGGDITIESTAGQGFRIHTVLPLHASEA
jgi:signal transduction histidine kinase